MLLAELHRKVARPFGCAQCGCEVNPEAAVSIEDALTSHVFGALRHLPSRAGVLPVLQASGFTALLPESGDVYVQAWPFGNVSLIGVGESVPSQVGLEPDVVMSADTFLATVEAKLGSKLGGDPLQLPKEVLWTVHRAEHRPWLLLCVTADRNEPLVPSFVVDDGIRLGPPAPVARSVGSYFDAVEKLAPERCWPSGRVVEERVKWISWRTLGATLDHAAGLPDVEPHHRRLLCDVVELLRTKGLSSLSFRGFSRSGSAPISAMPAIWRGESRTPELWARVDAVSFDEGQVAWLRRDERHGDLFRLDRVEIPAQFPRMWTTP